MGKRDKIKKTEKENILIKNLCVLRYLRNENRIT